MSDRAFLRAKITAERAFLAPEDVAERSTQVVENLRRWFAGNTRFTARLPELSLASYRVIPGNKDGEVDLATIGASPEFVALPIAYPRILDRFEKTMDVAVPSHATDWAKGSFGIPEPRYELPALRPEDLDLILIPGVAFGERGERLGRGAGFYDRFLAKAPRAVRVGIAFDFQVLALPIPQEAWDVRMDVVITESRVLRITEKA